MNPEKIGYIKYIGLKPIKSCGGIIELSEAKVTLRGVEMVDAPIRDHDFVIAERNEDPNGIHQFVHQRQKSMNVMTQIRPVFDGNGLQLTWAGEDKIPVPLDLTNGKTVKVQIWNDICTGVYQGDELSEWLSEHLKKPVMLVRAVGDFKRRTSQSYMENVNPLGTQDGYPIHWFSIESLQELSQKAGEDIALERFGPQVVGEGFDPQEEHLYWTLMLADILGTQAKPCTRCPIPNTNHITGKKGTQPTKALTQYKMWQDKRGDVSPIFGENIIPHDEGVIRVGDEIALIERRSAPLVYGSAREIKSK